MFSNMASSPTPKKALAIACEVQFPVCVGENSRHSPPVFLSICQSPTTVKVITCSPSTVQPPISHTTHRPPHPRPHQRLRPPFLASQVCPAFPLSAQSPPLSLFSPKQRRPPRHPRFPRPRRHADHAVLLLHVIIARAPKRCQDDDPRG